MPKGLKHVDTERVYSTILAHPGLGMRAIARLARLKPGLTRSHIAQLVDQRRVRTIDPRAPKYVPASMREAAVPARA